MTRGLLAPHVLACWVRLYLRSLADLTGTSWWQSVLCHFPDKNPWKVSGSCGHSAKRASIKDGKGALFQILPTAVLPDTEEEGEDATTFRMWG